MKGRNLARMRIIVKLWLPNAKGKKENDIARMSCVRSVLVEVLVGVHVFLVRVESEGLGMLCQILTGKIKW